MNTPGICWMASGLLALGSALAPRPMAAATVTQEVAAVSRAVTRNVGAGEVVATDREIGGKDYTSPGVWFDHNTWLKFELPAIHRVRIRSLRLNFGPYFSPNTVSEGTVSAYLVADDTWTTSTVSHAWPVNPLYTVVHPENNSGTYQSQRLSVDLTPFAQGPDEGLGRTLSLRLRADGGGNRGFRITNPANFTTLTLETTDAFEATQEIGAYYRGTTVGDGTGFRSLNEYGGKSGDFGGTSNCVTWLKFQLPPPSAGKIESVYLNFGPYTSFGGVAEPSISAACMTNDDWSASIMSNTYPAGPHLIQIQPTTSVSTYQTQRVSRDLTALVQQLGKDSGQTLSIQLTAAGAGNRGFRIKDPVNFTTLTVTLSERPPPGTVVLIR